MSDGKPMLSRGGGGLLLENLLNPNVTAVLIKGLPGTGKTTLALELLRIHGKGLYVSTRASEEKLARQYPHVKELIEKGKLIEVTPDIKRARFEDLRFGRAEDLMESVLQAVTKLKEPLIILDSWDAVAKELDPKERLRIEKSLVGMAEANKAKLIFVSEEPHLTTTDYLVDAIVTLKDEEIEGRRIRRIEWNKLRGIPISRKSYLFTLHGGRFTMFRRTEAQRPSGIEAKEFEPLEHIKTHYSTGSRDVDGLLEGGLRKGSTTLLEVGKTVPADWQLPLLASIELNFLAMDGCAVNTMYAGLTQYMLKEAIASYLPKDVVESRFRIGHYEEFRPDPCFFMLDHSVNKSFERLWNEVMKVRKVSGRPCFIFIDMDFVGLYNANVTESTVKLSLKVKQFNDVLMLKLEESNRDKEELSTFCDRHIKLDVVDETLIMYCVKPPSRIYHVGYDYSKGYPQVRLTPIV